MGRVTEKGVAEANQAEIEQNGTSTISRAFVWSKRVNNPPWRAGLVVSARVLERKSGGAIYWPASRIKEKTPQGEVER